MAAIDGVVLQFAASGDVDTARNDLNTFRVKLLNDLPPAAREFVQMEALIAVWGADGAEAFYKGATPHPTGGYDEVFVRCMMCCLAGDILYWRTTSEMLLQSVDSECAEVDMLVRAKKAQVYYTHAKMDMEQVGERLGIHVVVQ
jgi:hypothetical protein